MRKKCTELVFTTNRHSMALAFRSGTPPKASNAFNGGQPQSAEEALDNLKRAARGLAASTHGLLMEFTTLSQMTKINGGKLPDINAIAQQILDESSHSHPTGGSTSEANPSNQASLS